MGFWPGRVSPGQKNSEEESGVFDILEEHRGRRYLNHFDYSSLQPFLDLFFREAIAFIPWPILFAAFKQGFDYLASSVLFLIAAGFFAKEFRHCIISFDLNNPAMICPSDVIWSV